MKKIFLLICALFVVGNISAQTRKVGDIIMVGGEFGVVFAVTTDGRHGKAVSVSETECTWDNAKKWCAKLGYGWKLPTKDELQIIYRKKSAINSALSVNGYTTLKNEWYWSSTEYREFCAWDVSMYIGYTSTNPKNDSTYVRAVSAF